MNPLVVLFFISLIIDDYIFKDGYIIKYYLTFMTLYWVFYYFSKKSQYQTPYRKLLLAGYSQSYDPSIYGVIKPDIKKVKDYMDRYYQKTGKKISITLLFAKIVGLVISNSNDINNTINFGKHVDRGSVDICILVDIKGQNLGFVTLKQVDKKDLSSLLNDLQPKAEAVRTDNDKELRETNKILSKIPSLYITLKLA